MVCRRKLLGSTTQSRSLAVEIERKFIASPAVLTHCRSGTPLIQGYLYTDAANTIRIRQAGQHMLVTWKSPRRGASREEVEFAIPRADGVALLAGVPASRRLGRRRVRRRARGPDPGGDRTRARGSAGNPAALSRVRGHG